MDKQIAELIKTLNGGLQHLPDLAKEMVHQYVVGHMFLGITLIILSAVIIAVYFISLKGDPKWAVDSVYGGASIAVFVIPIVDLGLIIIGIGNVYKALTPIWSIIRSLT